MDVLGIKSEYGSRKLTGPILDVDYEQEPTVLQHEIPSLQEACGKKIVSDSYLTRSYISVMPNNIKAFIMRCALTEGRFPTISFLLKNWPYRTFKFPQLPVLKAWLLACSAPNWVRFPKNLRKALQCVSAVLYTFLEVVQNGHMETKLRFLDLSAVPLSEHLVASICNFISDHDAPQPHNTNAENNSAVERYTIKVHCTLNTSKMTEELHSALVKEEMGLSVIKLSVCGLTFGSYSLCRDRGDLDLIRTINPADLQVISFDFLSAAPRTYQVLNYLTTFHNLRVLDFSYFPVCVVGGINFFTILQNLLRELVHVSRIDISNCFAKDGIKSLLGQLHQSNNVPTDSNDFSFVHKKSKVACSNPHCQGFPRGNLEYLCVSGCRLSSCDLEFLANLPQARTLKNLNLCNNPLGDKLNSLLVLLQALAPSLYVLEIADTYFRDEQISELFSALSKMENLRFLNIGNSRTSHQTLLHHLPVVCRLPRLKLLGLSVPQSLLPTEIHEFRTCAVNVIRNQGSTIDLLWQH